MRRFTASAVVVGLWSIGLPASGELLYWTDYQNNRIVRSNLDGTGQATVLGNLSGATALAIDDSIGKMYWSETGAVNRIRRANLDGSNLETVLNTAGPVFDIALDVPLNTMVFTQAFTPVPEVEAAIRAATLTGASPHDVVTGNNFSPNTVALFDQQIYYAGNGAGSIRQVNYDGTGDAEHIAVAGGGTFDLLFGPQDATRLYWLDEDDDVLRGDDDDFNLFPLHSVGPAGERVPWGLVSDGQRLIWTDAAMQRVQSIDFLGQDYQFFPVEGEPRRLAIAVPEPSTAGVLLGAMLLRLTCRGRRE